MQRAPMPPDLLLCDPPSPRAVLVRAVAIKDALAAIASTVDTGEEIVADFSTYANDQTGRR